MRFRRALETTGLGAWAEERTKADPRFKGVKDFRRTTARYVDGVRVAEENILPEDQFVLFDLGAESLLEPITDDTDDFRVTCYDPRLMAKTHGKDGIAISSRATYWTPTSSSTCRN